MNNTVVVDSDAIFAIYNPNDPLNASATFVFGQLIAREYRLVYPTSVIFEVVSLFQRVLPTPRVTAQLVAMIEKGEFVTYIIDEELLKSSVRIFDPEGSKKHTLIDCSVTAVALKIKAQGVFSYDEFYRKKGFSLAADLIK